MYPNLRVSNLIVLFSLAIGACSPFVVQPPPAPPITSIASPAIPTATNTALPIVLWVSPGLPPFLKKTALDWGLATTADRNAATLSIDLARPAPGALRVSTWIYALVAPFPTVTDGVASEDLLAAWNGSSSGPFSGRPLLMDEATLAAFTALWGQPAANAVEIVPADQLLDTAWSEMPAWGIVPFEALDKKWKVLSVDGKSPIHKNFDPSTYPLTIAYRLTCSEPCPLPSLPSFEFTNRDPSLMTTLIMTGVTALVRATAKTMDLKGITYPGRDIGDILREADITHISNEIPFYDACDAPNPKSGRLVFCSNPRYIDLLTDVGADVIELTGNHFADYGQIAMKQTLDIYKQAGLPYFAGGMNDVEAKKPLLMEKNGNKFAFIGCNRPDTGFIATAASDRPGAAPCDFKYMTSQISDLSSKGYVVVTTFQWNESYDPKPHPLQVRDFQMMADAGASIVSGSQAHYSQIMEFHGNSFIHYGLGNLFFDQMDKPVSGTRREFLDRYVIYDGKVISIELLTAMLEDYSRPRPMTAMERSAFLSEYFYLSGWTPFEATPTPAPTMTLTPLALPRPVGTPAP
jgi:poly-gamma-glutamate synthesis protein (capsule biosynthesis protein)